MRTSLNNSFSYKQQDPQYYGQNFDILLANGPTEQRKCRDCIFLILYLGFLVFMIVIGVIAFIKGQPHLLAAPFDSTGQQCGYSPGYQDYQYAYFNSQELGEFCCINQCPGLKGLTSDINCKYNNSQIKCSSFGNYSTVRFVGVCYPNDSQVTKSINLGIDFMQQSISDISTTWPILLSILFMSLILSVFMLLFIRKCGGCFIFTIILLYFAALIVLGVMLLLAGNQQITIKALNNLNDLTLLKFLAYLTFAIAAVSLIFVICSIKKIKIGVTVMKTTAEFIQKEAQTILVPVFMLIAIILFLVWWAVVSVFIYSSGTVTACHGSPYTCIEWNQAMQRSIGLYFFGLFWNCEVAIGMCQFVLASTTAYWYFSHLEEREVSSPVCKSFCRGMTYHLGSIALGALILTILWIVQLFLEMLHFCLKQKTVSTDPITNACVNCCVSYSRCCLACFQRFIRFITKNAYIMMAISGSGFCTAAHQSFYLILKSTQQYTITHGIGHLIMFFIKIFITTSCTVSGYFMILKIDHFSDNLFEYATPTIIFFVISFVVSSLFMDVFAIGSDTLLMCYCLERDILNGKVRACPQKLKSALQ